MTRATSKHRGQLGFTLIETLLAMFILGFLGVTLLTGLWSLSRVNIVGKEQTTAESLARSEMEFIKTQPYQSAPVAAYGTPSSLPIPAGWTMSTSVASVHTSDDGIQAVTVYVSHNGRGILSVTDYKVNR